MLDFRKSYWHLAQGAPTASLSAASDADLCALVSGLSAEPTPHREDDAGSRRFRGLLHRTSVGNQDGTGARCRLSQAQTSRWSELGKETGGVTICAMPVMTAIPVQKSTVSPA